MTPAHIPTLTGSGFSEGAGGPWLHDWGAYETVYDYARGLTSTGGKTWRTFVDEVTGPGFLLFVRGWSSHSGASLPDVRVTVDGTPYVFEGDLDSLPRTGNKLLHPLPYQNTLKIEVYNGFSTSADLGCDYLYLRATGTPDPDIVTILGAGDRLSVYHMETSNTLTDVANVAGAGYLLGIMFSAYSTSTSTEYSRGTVIVDGVTKMDDQQLVRIGAESHKTHYFPGPVRFASALRVQHRMDANNIGGAVTRVWYTLDP